MTLVPIVGPSVSQLTDDELHDGMLALLLACGRSHGVLSRKHEQWFCFLFRVLKVEADLRGLPAPTAPVHTGDLPHGAL